MYETPGRSGPYQEGPEPAGRPRSRLVLFNISKRRNFGALLRTAEALGVSEVLVVGRRRFTKYGSHGADDPRRRRHFWRPEEAVAWLRERGSEIVGIEIAEGALPVQEARFDRDVAFIPGHETEGLRPDQLRICDRTVYVPQHGRAGSLNVNAATAIVLHHFAAQAGFPESPRRGQKFHKTD